MKNIKITEKGRHFVTGPFVSHASFIGLRAYSLARDSIVRGCIECLVVDKRRKLILLGKRNIEPWPQWWSFGSRMVVGESPEQTCARTVKIDLGINADIKRFIFLDVFSLAFARRQELPKKNGCHDLSVFHLVSLSQKEISALQFRKTEYRAIKWFSVKDILGGGPKFHPATKRIIKEAIKRRLISSDYV